MTLRCLNRRDFVTEELSTLYQALQAACEQDIELTGKIHHDHVGEAVVRSLGGYRVLAKMLVEESENHSGNIQKGARHSLEHEEEKSSCEPRQMPKFVPTIKPDASSPLVKHLLEQYQADITRGPERPIACGAFKGKLTQMDIRRMTPQETMRLVNWRKEKIEIDQKRGQHFMVDGRKLTMSIQKMLLTRSPEDQARLIRDMEAAKFGKLIDRSVDFARKSAPSHSDSRSDDSTSDMGSTRHDDDRSTVAMSLKSADTRSVKLEAKLENFLNSVNNEMDGNELLVERISKALQSLTEFKLTQEIVNSESLQGAVMWRLCINRKPVPRKKLSPLESANMRMEHLRARNAGKDAGHSSVTAISLLEHLKKAD